MLISGTVCRSHVKHEKLDISIGLSKWATNSNYGRTVPRVVASETRLDRTECASVYSRLCLEAKDLRVRGRYLAESLGQVRFLWVFFCAVLLFVYFQLGVTRMFLYTLWKESVNIRNTRGKNQSKPMGWAGEMFEKTREGSNKRDEFITVVPKWGRFYSPGDFWPGQISVLILWILQGAPGT